MRFDAVVIGSGPAGATAAQLLAKTGWSVALVERAGFPRRKVCGEFISAATMPVLEACGIASDFIALAGPPVRKVAGYAGTAMVEAPLPRGPGGSGWGRALGREHLDVLLRDAAVEAGAHLVQPAEVTALRREADGHAITLDNEGRAEELTARIVIAACGSWNAKGPFAITPNARPSDLFAFKAHFRESRLPEDVMPLLAFPGGYGGMVHSDSGRSTLSCCIRRDVLARARSIHGGKAAEAVFRHILATTSGVRLALQSAVLEGTFLSTGPIRPGIRSRHADGVFFVGNMAGEAHPIIAEGISMAIQSSWLLAQSLLAFGPAAGKHYARAWRKQFAPRLQASSAFAHLAMNDHSRAAAARLIGAFPAILSWGAALSGKATPVIAPRGPETGIGIRHDAA